MLGRTLKGPDQLMTLLCELDNESLATMARMLDADTKKGDPGGELFLSWILFVMYLRRVGHLLVRPWDKQRPEFYKPE